GGWSRATALDKILELQHLNVQFIEQPLPKNDWEGMKELFKNSPLPLIADESCVAEEDVLRCPEHFHGVNIKLTKCSGITPARRMIDKCRELKLMVMLGCMNESSVGSAAIAHLAPLVDFLDMDGPLLLAKDIAVGQKIEDGKIIFNDLPGLGVTMLN
ncbi:MAG: dipeptide epimerase, partial [Chitinophagaceae bacterium]